MKSSVSAMRSRLALCNEVLMPMSFEAQCAYAAGLGYRAIELAPFTVSDDPATLDERRAAQLARIAADAGLKICGLHWLLVAPAGMSISTAEPAVRQRTVAFMCRLVDLCAQLGADYLVHGSPAQRRIDAGQTHASALGFATDSWASAAEAAERAGVVYCIEPLSADQTPLVNTLEQAVAIVDSVGVSALRTMLDTSSAGLSEAEPIERLIDRWLPSGHIAHVQLNDRNRRAPGQGDDDFAPVLAALARHDYRGWIAMEPFDYRPDGPGCAAYAIGYVRGLLDAGRAG
jgi:D-psicose/D-tagatose/L-ribulose 3-epimerase